MIHFDSKQQFKLKRASLIWLGPSDLCIIEDVFKPLHRHISKCSYFNLNNVSLETMKGIRSFTMRRVFNAGCSFFSFNLADIGSVFLYLWLNSVLYRELIETSKDDLDQTVPRTTLLTLFKPWFLYRKGTPFLILTDNWYPFHIPSSERNASLLTAVNAPSF